MWFEGLVHSPAKNSRGGNTKKLQGTVMWVSLQLRKQIEDELLGLSTHHGSLRNLQKRTNLSSMPMEVCLRVWRLQTWLFWSYTHSSKNISGATGSHLQLKKGIQESSLPVMSPTSLSSFCLPWLEPAFLQHSSFLLPNLFPNLQLPLLPAQEAAPMGAAAATAHNSPNECQPQVICRHQVDYCFLREWKRKRGAQA